MQVTVQRISPVLLELHVEIPADRVRSEVDKAYVNLGRTAHVRGFRPGKAPRNILSRVYGERVSNDVASAIVNDTLPKVLSDKNVTPVTRPTVEAGKFLPTEPFSYKARFEVQPEIENVNYEGFELVRPKLEATTELVDEQIEALRQRHATLKAPEPARPSQKGDVLTIDFTISVDGADVKDAGGQGVQIELGAGQALPELDAALMEKNVGDVVKVSSTFPATHQNPALREKTGEFKVTVTEVKERLLPAIDDEFAKDVGQFQTLVELRADVHSRLEQSVKERQEAALAEQIITKLNERNPIEVPPSLVEQQCRAMEQEVVAQARRVGQRITPDQVKAMHDQIHNEAEKKVRAGLLMAAIARKGDFKVTDQDIEKGMQELAQQSGKNVAKVRAEYRDANKRQMLMGLILEDKVLDLVEGKATITDGDPAQAAGTSEKGEAKEAEAGEGGEGDKSAEAKADKPAAKKKAKKTEP